MGTAGAEEFDEAIADGVILGINGVLNQSFAEGLSFGEGEQICEEKVDASKTRIVEMF